MEGEAISEVVVVGSGGGSRCPFRPRRGEGGDNRSSLVGIQISNGGEQQPAKATGSAVLPLACGPRTLGPLSCGQANGTERNGDLGGSRARLAGFPRVGLRER